MRGVSISFCSEDTFLGLVNLLDPFLFFLVFCFHIIERLEPFCRRSGRWMICFMVPNHVLLYACVTVLVVVLRIVRWLKVEFVEYATLTSSWRLKLHDGHGRREHEWRLRPLANRRRGYRPQRERP